LVSGRRFAGFRDDSGLVFSPVVRYQAVMNDNSIESLAKKLADSLPGGLRTMREDLEQNFRSILRGGLEKLDLVTREEFEVQEAVLARTREKLEALEKQVAELEGSAD
jgi:BMFP domain-containing protein YqiC